MRLSKYFLLLNLIVSLSSTLAQTCCSGGVPVSSNLGIDNLEGQTMALVLSWDYNFLNTLKEKSTTIEDNSRQRKTKSILLQLGYGIHHKWSIDALFSYIQQERIIQQINGFNDADNTHGFGDVALLIKYQIIDNDDQSFKLNIGIGPKLPLGRYDLRDERSIYYSADLQPGSGAFDVIYRSNASFVLPVRPSLSLTLSSIYSDKGINNNYLKEGDQYRFGDEVQFLFTLADQVLLKGQIFDLTSTFRYRRALQDQFNKKEIPATGGEWIFISPSLSWYIQKDLSLQFQVEVPLYANVNQTQLTPTIRSTIGIRKNLVFTNSKFDLP